MKIFITGTRGIPDIPGGIEKHCQNIYPLIVSKGHDVYVVTRRSYVKNHDKKWNGVNLIDLYAPASKNLEAIVHTFLAVLKARLCNADILHIHAIGPGLMVPLARLIGLKVVVTHHGPDYNRGKWSQIAKAGLKLGEWLSGKYAHEVIAISKIIQNILKKRCNRVPAILYNGVFLPKKSKNIDFLTSLDIKPGKYILAVSRIEPEKGLDILVDAFKQLKTKHKLVIAGYTHYKTEYNTLLQKKIISNSRIILSGFITGDPLAQLYSHAGLFVLPSYHEGLPIALLEAMSYGLSVLVSDIPANLEVGLSKKRYFKCGDAMDLKKKIDYHFNRPITMAEKSIFRALIQEKYNWEKIAAQTIKVYEKALTR